MLAFEDRKLLSKHEVLQKQTIAAAKEASDDSK
jgi:hypothetical protein